MKRAEKKSRPAAANNRATAYPVNETLESIFSISSECLFCKGVNRFEQRFSRLLVGHPGHGAG